MRWKGYDLMKLLFSIILFSSSLLYATGYDYLNAQRTKAGLYALSQQTHLEAAAQNHSNYMQINNAPGHGESSGNSGYTGASPGERALYAGYLSKIVTENVSYGKPTVQGSTDSLLSAIYHRFSLLTYSYDQVGIAQSNSYYTFDLGNSGLNDYCLNGIYSGGTYYVGICADSEKKMSVDDYNVAKNARKATAPKLILWPPVNGDDILPVFYEEIPDPLSAHSVTGYPISVQFNDGRFDTPPSLSSFTVKDTTGTQLETIVILDHDNDPQSLFTDYQFALFPKERFEWGSKYNAELIYNDNGTETTETWCFSTRSLQGSADRFYRIENNSDVSLNVVSGKTYAIYVVSNDTNDILGSVRYSYTSNAPEFSYIDNNTVFVKITGNTGQWVDLEFDNGQNVKLTIAGSDNAIVPKHETCSNAIPDYIPTLTAQGTIITGSSGVLDLLIRVGEFNSGVNFDGNLVFTMVKNTNLTIDFNSTETTRQSYTVQNALWELRETSGLYIFTYIGNSGIFSGSTASRVGLSGIFLSPNSAKGQFALDVTVVGGTGENNTNNNKDKDILEYNNL